MKALIIGGCSWDTLIKVGDIHSLEKDMSLWADNVVETVGGTGAGKALCLDTLGYDYTWITEIGNDIFGQKITQYLDLRKVQYLSMDVDKSTAHTNIMHSGGDRISVFTSSPTKESKPYHKIEEIIIESDLVYLNINQFCRQYIPLIKKHNKKVIVDLHDYNIGNPYHQDFIDIANVLTVSGVYITDQTSFLKQMIKNGKEIVIITNGNEGSIAMDSSGSIYKTPSYQQIEYVDSNGAGDSFCAIFGMEYYATKNIGKSLQLAAICGAMSCTTFDLFPNEITIEDIKKRVE